MIEILFERDNISAGKLPERIRMPANIVFGALRKFTFVGNVWDLAYVVTEHACRNAVKDGFEIREKEINATRLHYVISGAPEKELDFIKQYQEKFMNVGAADVLKAPYQFIKNKVIKNVQQEKLIKAAGSGSLGSYMSFFGIRWKVEQIEI